MEYSVMYIQTYRGVLYLQNVIAVHGTSMHISLILFVNVRKVRPSVCPFS